MVMFRLIRPWPEARLRAIPAHHGFGAGRLPQGCSGRQTGQDKRNSLARI